MKHIDGLDFTSILKQYVEDYGHDDIEDIEDDEWVQEGKYQHSAAIVKHVPTGRFFCINRTRYGSPWSDWDYNDPEFSEVRPVTKTITVTTYEAVEA